MKNRTELLEEMGWKFLPTGPDEFSWIKFDGRKQIAVGGDLIWVKDNNLIHNKFKPNPNIKAPKNEWIQEGFDPMPSACPGNDFDIKDLVIIILIGFLIVVLSVF